MGPRVPRDAWRAWTDSEISGGDPRVMDARKCSSGGTSASMAMATTASAGTPSHAATASSTSSPAGTMLRRRLSKIFQRERSDNGFGRRPTGPGTRGNSQAAICQSPRIHRCRRATSAR